jgi:hypothetical protein
MDDQIIALFSLYLSLLTTMLRKNRKSICLNREEELTKSKVENEKDETNVSILMQTK